MDVVAAFPKRALNATAAARAKGAGTVAWLVLLLLLTAPVLIALGLRAPAHVQEAGLRARGVEAASTQIAGNCVERRNRTTGKKVVENCTLDVTYALRPQDGGGTLQGKAKLRDPGYFIDGYGPSAVYDPAAPTHMALRPWLDQLPSRIGGTIFIVGFLLLLPLIGIAVWVMTAGQHKAFAAAARRGQVEVLPVASAVRHANTGQLTVHYQRAGETKPRAAYPFDATNGRTPLMARGPGPGQYVVALIGANGRAHLLDATLLGLDLTTEERQAILNAAVS